MSGCFEYHDIYEKPDAFTGEARKAVDERNKKNGKLYKAVRYVLMKSFNGPDFMAVARPAAAATAGATATTTDTAKKIEVAASAVVPEDPANFNGDTLSEHTRARFLAVLGMIQADNWEDPSLGKERKVGDDLVYEAPGETFVIDRRFADAVVDAIKDFTMNSDLFIEVYKELQKGTLNGSRT